MKRTTLQTALALALPALLSGCYIVPVGPEAMVKLNTLLEQAQAANAPQGTTQPAKPSAASGPTSSPAPAVTPAPASAPSVPMTLHARLYPANEIATENGMVAGTVTNMMNGKGRLQMNYRGELLTGEATRVSGDERKGVASAWGPNGSFMSCEYQMSSPLRGAGICSFSDGARYQVHVGN
jgi:hypothetical protein